MLVCRHPIGSTRNVRVKKIIRCSFLEKIFSHKYSVLAMLTLLTQGKLLVLSSASFFNCSYFFDFSYPLSFAQVSLDCASIGCQINRWKGSAAAIRNRNDLENFQM